MEGLKKFDPSRHIPVTAADRALIEHAFWEGWELMVDSQGTVWIGDHEERIAAVAVQAA